MKEYEKHIADMHVDYEGKSICGEEIPMQFAFQGLDHWFQNERAEGRLVGCPKCLEVIKHLLD